MTWVIGLVLLFLGFLGVAAMLILAIRSTRRAYHVKCKQCGCTTTLPQENGEYYCQGCGVPLARVTTRKAR